MLAPHYGLSFSHSPACKVRSNSIRPDKLFKGSAWFAISLLRLSDKLLKSVRVACLKQDPESRRSHTAKSETLDRNFKVETTNLQRLFSDYTVKIISIQKINPVRANAALKTISVEAAVESWNSNSRLQQPTADS